MCKEGSLTEEDVSNARENVPTALKKTPFPFFLKKNKDRSKTYYTTLKEIYI